jgi:hypothetical protein
MSLLAFGIALALIVLYQLSLSDDAADAFRAVVGDPELVIPTTVLDLEATEGAGGAARAVGGGSSSATAPRAPTAGPRDAPGEGAKNGPRAAASDRGHGPLRVEPSQPGNAPAGALLPPPATPTAAGERSEGAPTPQSR